MSHELKGHVPSNCICPLVCTVPRQNRTVSATRPLVFTLKGLVPGGRDTVLLYMSLQPVPRVNICRGLVVLPTKAFIPRVNQCSSPNEVNSNMTIQMNQKLITIGDKLLMNAIEYYLLFFMLHEIFPTFKTE